MLCNVSNDDATPNSRSSIFKLFDKIKSNHGALHFSYLENELHENYYINIKKYCNFELFVLYSENISFSLVHQDKLLAELINDCKHYIIDINKMNPILTFFNNESDNQTTKKALNSISWNNVICFPWNLSSVQVCLFSHNNEWYLTYEHDIIKLSDLSTLNNIAQTFGNLTNAKINFDTLDKNLCYYFIINDSMFRNIGMVDIEPSTILHIFTTVKYDLSKFVDCDINIPKLKNVYFSCFDELLTSIDQINYTDLSNKQLTMCGYCLYVYDSDKNTYTFFKIKTDLYIQITNLLPKYPNKYWGYLELYQNDKLNDILPYIHKYHFDIVKRINATLKTLSKELLNIYHLTRKKNNSALYDILSQDYKKTLHDLHFIYTEQKYSEYIIKTHDDLKERKSINVNIVYMYLKKIDSSRLRQLLSDRKVLLSSIKQTSYATLDIIYHESIDILTLTELMGI